MEGLLLLHSSFPSISGNGRPLVFATAEYFFLYKHKKGFFETETSLILICCSPFFIGYGSHNDPGKIVWVRPELSSTSSPAQAHNLYGLLMASPRGIATWSQLHTKTRKSSSKCM
jgi:hypothetical protein